MYEQYIKDHGGAAVFRGMNVKEKLDMKSLTPLKAIRAKCLDCCCGMYSEVKLWFGYRLRVIPVSVWQNPNRAGIGNKNLFQQKKNSVSTNDFEDQAH